MTALSEASNAVENPHLNRALESIWNFITSFEHLHECAGTAEVAKQGDASNLMLTLAQLVEGAALPLHL